MEIRQAYSVEQTVYFESKTDGVLYCSDCFKVQGHLVPRVKRAQRHKICLSESDACLRDVVHIWSPCFRGFANNKGIHQPAHPRSLISAFVIRLLETSII